MKKLISIILLFTICTSLLIGMNKLNYPNYYSDADIFVDKNDVHFSTIINLKFTKNIIDLSTNKQKAEINQIKNNEIKSFIINLNSSFGPIEIIKEFPSETWGDTIKTNIRTGKKVNTPDLSQIYKIRTSKIFNIDSLVREIKKIPFIDYVEGPIELFLTYEPNDPLFVNGDLWHLYNTETPHAWDITKGDSNIVVSVNDQYDDTITTLHDDLINKVVYQDNPNRCGGHGIAVAGCVGAETDNGFCLSSIGFNTSIDMARWGSIASINSAISRGVDVINFSWMTSSSYCYRDVIHSALLQGVICVSAAGNTDIFNNDPPKVVYPACYNFGSDGQVIAVSATRIVDYNELFVEGYNYSPGIDPIGDPINAFIDVACPGYRMMILHTFIYNSYGWGYGTSDASPQVAGLVALILSINNSLTPQQVYEIIINSTDKIGQYPYDEIGWNQYLGYGRINAYKALKYTLENYGGTLKNNLTITDTWTFQEGATINIENGKRIDVYGEFIINGSTDNKVTFYGNGFSEIHTHNNSDLNINNAIIDGIGIYASSGSNVDFSNSEIKNTSVGFISINANNININNSFFNNCEVGVEVLYGYANINNCTFENNYYCGLYFVNTNTNLSDNDVMNNGYAGIHISNSFGTFFHNEISDNNYGLYIINNSGPEFTEIVHLSNVEEWTNNQILNNEIGIYIDDANPKLGDFILWEPFVLGGFNEFENDDYDVYNEGDEVDIRMNIWGGPMIEGDVLFEPTVQQFIDFGLGKTLGKIKYNSKKSIYSFADSLVVDSQYEEAFAEYEKLINEMPNDSISIKTLINIVALNRKLSIDSLYKDQFTDETLVKRLERISYKYPNTPVGDLSLDMQVTANIWAGEYKRAILLGDDLYTKYSRIDEYEKAAYMLYEQHSALKFHAETKTDDLSKSEGLIKQSKAKADLILSQYSESNAANAVRLSRGLSLIITDEPISNTTPQEYALHQCYPNPFNPVTNIAFDLPKESKISLIAYDIKGRKVWEYENNGTVMNAGKYEIQWDGKTTERRQLASGIYLIQLRTAGFVDVKKVVLLK